MDIGLYGLMLKSIPITTSSHYTGNLDSMINQEKEIMI